MKARSLATASVDTSAASKICPSVDFLKFAPLGSPASGRWFPAAGSEQKTSVVVADMLENIRREGESVALRYAEDLDNWPAGRDVLVSEEAIEQATAALSQPTKDDCHFQLDRVRAFAEQQRSSMHDFEFEVSPGTVLGQRLVPVSTAGCYVPGGRFSHVSSAIMSVATARVAEVETVVACSPPVAGTADVHPATLYAMHIAGADHIMSIGGVQAVAAMAYGLFTPARPADVIVGPGNAYVAEAKRQLFGQLGIDMFAGPTETCVLADEGADPRLVASDLVSQAEHGVNSPAWLICTSTTLGCRVLKEVDVAIERLCADEPTSACREAWRDYGEVVVCPSREDMAALSDLYAPEHLHVQAADLDWWRSNLRNYGSLFLGEETTVTYGDKCSGTNHTLPTKSASRYTGGLSVDKFIKKLTWQQMTREANRTVGSAAARISRLEGMEGHARSADDRLAKYFPGEEFHLGK